MTTYSLTEKKIKKLINKKILLDKHLSYEVAIRQVLKEKIPKIISGYYNPQTIHYGKASIVIEYGRNYYHVSIYKTTKSTKFEGVFSTKLKTFRVNK